MNREIENKTIDLIAKEARIDRLRLLISTGEVSGDRYGAQLLAALHVAARAAGLELDVHALGGPRMAAAGARLIADSAARGGVGFIEPLRHVIPGYSAYLRLRLQLRHWRPHAVVLLDYPGFNIPLAQRLRRLGCRPIIYYIPPEECIWSKKSNGRFDRTRQVVENTDLILALHERDSAFYRAWGARVQCVGHPLPQLLEGVVPGREQARSLVAPDHNGPLAALFPASRRLELRLVWPVMAQAAAHMATALPELRFPVPLAAPHLESALLRAVRWAQRTYPVLAGRLLPLIGSAAGVEPSLLAVKAADVAIAKSGSVTLELALCTTPQVMVYRVDRVTEWIAKRLLGVRDQDFARMSLPNFLLDRDLVPEYKQAHADPAAIARAALELLDDGPPARAVQLAGYAELRNRLGGGADRAAAAILAAVRG